MFRLVLFYFICLLVSSRKSSKTLPRGFVVGPGSETSGDSVFGLYGDLMNLEVSATSGVSVFCLFGDLMNLEVSVTSEVSVFGLFGSLMNLEVSVT